MGQIVLPGNYRLENPHQSRLFGAGTLLVETFSTVTAGQTASNQRPIESAFRFKSTQSGKVNRIWFRIDLTGSSTANLPTVKIEVRDNDGSNKNWPTATYLFATGQYTVTAADVQRGYVEVETALNHTAPKDIAVNSFFHVVFKCDQPNRFARISVATVRSSLGDPCRWLHPYESSVLFRDKDGQWFDIGYGAVDHYRYAPLCGVRFANGNWVGRAVRSVQTGWRLSSTNNIIRERFIMDENRRICGLSLYMACEQTGVMFVKGDVNGHDAFQFRINASQASYSRPHDVIYGAWYDVQFFRDVFVPKGGELAIYFVAEGNSVWWLSSQMNGTPVSFRHSTTEIKRSAGNDWSPLRLSNHSQSGTANETSMQMVLHTTEHFTPPVVNPSPPPPVSPPPPPPPPPATGGGSSGSVNALLRSAIDGISSGNEVQYIGWGSNNEGAPGIQGQGGALTIGGIGRFSEIEGTELGTCRGGMLFDGAFECYNNSSGPSYSRVRTRQFDQLAPWIVLVRGHGDNARVRPLVNIRSISVYVLQKGENIWRLGYKENNASISWQGAYRPDMRTHVPEEYNDIARLSVFRNGYRVMALPNNQTLNNHAGMGDLPYPKRFSPDRVEGYLMIVEARLDPSTPNSVVGMQVGIDPKFDGEGMPEGGFFPGLFVSKLFRLSSQWRQCAVVNASHQLNGQRVGDSHRGGRGLSTARILNTTIEGM